MTIVKFEFRYLIVIFVTIRSRESIRMMKLPVIVNAVIHFHFLRHRVSSLSNFLKYFMKRSPLKTIRSQTAFNAKYAIKTVAKSNMRPNLFVHQGNIHITIGVYIGAEYPIITRE